MTGGWFSQTGLTRLHEVMAGHVERGDMPGSIALVARHGRAHVDVIGTRTFGDIEPLQRDDVFRMTSMTKPITAAAVMALVDDGTLHLDAPVDDLLPELANRRVLRSIDARLDDTVPLLNCDAHDGGRILSKESVVRMTTDHLEPSQRAFASPFLGDTVNAVSPIPSGPRMRSRNTASSDLAVARSSTAPST